MVLAHILLTHIWNNILFVESFFLQPFAVVVCAVTCLLIYTLDCSLIKPLLVAVVHCVVFKWEIIKIYSGFPNLGQTNKHIDARTTYRLNCPRGWLSENQLNRTVLDKYTNIHIFFNIPASCCHLSLPVEGFQDFIHLLIWIHWMYWQICQ